MTRTDAFSVRRPRTWPRAAWRLISSRRLSVVLMIGLAGLHVMWVLPFQFYGTPAWRTRNIATAWVFVTVASALLLNTLACMISRWPQVARRCGPTPRLRARRGGVVISTPMPSYEALEKAAGAVDASVEAEGETAVRVAGRYGPFGTELFHLALALVAIAFAVNTIGFFRGKVVLAEGEAFDGRDRTAYVEPPVSQIALVNDSVLPDVQMTLVEVKPSFWKDVQLFNGLEALVDVEPAGKRKALGINRSLYADGAAIAVDGFGYAPELRMTSPEGYIAERVLKLTVFPPGATDEFDVPDTPYRLRLAVYPDATREGTEVVNSSFNLVNPLILVRVEDPLQGVGEEPAFQGMLRPGQEAEFLGYTISFPAIHYYAELRVVRNPGAPWFIAGGVLALSGLVLRCGFRRREILIRTISQGDRAQVEVCTAAEAWGRSYRRRVVERISAAISGEKLQSVSVGEGGEERG